MPDATVSYSRIPWAYAFCSKGTSYSHGGPNWRSCPSVPLPPTQFSSLKLLYCQEPRENRAAAGLFAPQHVGFQLVKNLTAMQEILVHFLGQEVPLEKG